MTAMPIDARSLDSPSNGAIPFRGRNARLVNGGQWAIMEGDRNPTELGWYLLRRMAAHDPPFTQAEFATAMKVSQSTVSRWIYADIRPDPALLHRAANVLGDDPNHILTVVGYVGATPPPSTDVEPDRPLVDRLRHVLSGPLTDAERATLEAVIAGVLQPYESRQPVRRRRTG